MKKVLIFGTGTIGELAHFYFTHDSQYEIVAFTANEEFIKEKEFLGLPLVPFETIEKSYAKVVYHIYVIQLRLEKLKVGRREVFEALRAENIGVNVHYLPVHLQPFYRREFGYKRGDYPKAEQYYDRAITLPIFPKMGDEDVEDVIEAVRKVIFNFKLI